MLKMSFLVLIINLFSTLSYALTIDVHIHPASKTFHEKIKIYPEYDSAKILADMNKNSIDIGFLLSLGFSYFLCNESDAFGCSKEDIRPLVIAENDFTIEQATAAPDRFLAFCSFPMDVPWALNELDRCHKRGAKGLKIHLAAQYLNLANAETTRTVSEIIDRAEQYKMMVLIHPSVTNAEESFGNLVSVSAGRTIPIIWAHGLDPNWRLFQQFHLAVGDEARQFISNIFTDLSAFLVNYPDAPLSLYQEILWYLRQLGVGQLLFATDAPSFSIEETLNMIKNNVSSAAIGRYGFNESEMAQVLGGNAVGLMKMVGVEVKDKRLVLR